MKQGDAPINRIEYVDGNTIGRRDGEQNTRGGRGVTIDSIQNQEAVYRVVPAECSPVNLPRGGQAGGSRNGAKEGLPAPHHLVCRGGRSGQA